MAGGRQAVVRMALVLAALVVVALFLILPAIFVFAEAFAKGAQVFAAVLVEPETLAAIQLTLIAAAISVTANTLCGLAAAWCIAKVDFPGKGARW
jgi:sulfate transport system permease protein